MIKYIGCQGFTLSGYVTRSFTSTLDRGGAVV